VLLVTSRRGRRVPPGRTRSALVAIVLGATLLAGCGAERREEPAAEPAGSQAGHIHGLGVDPADGSLLIATHSGLFRAQRGAREVARVGDSRQDTMGFTVVGPGEYLGSGHPDVRDDLPGLLGLLRSNDAGRSWTPVSLLGQADFHALRASGRTVYGADATSGKLLVSADGGRTWQERTPPAPVLDLAVDPAAPGHLVATTEAGLFSSRDAGRRWRPLDRELIGLLTWTDALVLVDGRGAVRRSADGGRTWTEAGSIGAPPAALTSDGRTLLVATPENLVRRSGDGGRTWETLLEA